MSGFTLEKWVWTEEDFKNMGWHDCRIYAIAFDEENNRLLLDIDYILKWETSPESKYFKFWIAPATIVFENVHSLQLDVECLSMKLEIEGLKREEPRKPFNFEYIKKDTEWKWTLDTHQGELNFWAVGYKQYIRRQPALLSSQYIGLGQRGGISFSIQTEE
jgi:hypothetical protein